MRVITAAVAFALIAISSLGQSAHYKFRKLDITNSLSNNQIRSIFVDSKGYAWFGTVSGLNRFDGYGFKVFKNNPGDSLSIPFNTISRIYEDYNGLLWVFNSEDQLSIYDPASETFGIEHPVFSNELPVPRNYISALWVDRDSCLWLGNNQHGLFKFCPRSNKVSKLHAIANNTKTLQCDNITDIREDGQGNIVTVNRYGLIETIDRQSMQVVARVQLGVARNEEVMQNFSLFIDNEGDFWVFAQNEASGLHFFSPRTGIQKWLTDASQELKLSNNIISGVRQDLLGMIWVGTDHGGINIIDKKRNTVTVVEHRPGDVNSLGQNSVTSLYADKQGIVWVGTFKSGLSFYHPGLFQFSHVRNNPFVGNSLPANDIDCFAEDMYGNLWIGTNGDGLLYFNRATNTYKTYKHNPSDPNSLSSDVVVSLCVDSRNRLWVGTFYGGLNMYDGHSFKRFLHNPNDPRTISDNRIWSVLEDSQQRIWVATLGGGLDLYDGRDNRFTHYKSGDANSIHSDYVLSLAQDKAGSLWVGTSNGVNVLDHRSGRILHYGAAVGKEPGLSNGICMSLAIDNRGWAWVGTRGGLNVIDPEGQTFRSFTTKEGLSDDNVVSVLVDERGNVWMGTLNGICMLEITHGTSLPDLKYRIRSFDTMDGVQGKEFNEHSAFKTSKGELMFGGANGYNIFSPEAIKTIAFNTQVHLTALKLQNQNVPIGAEVGGRVVLPTSIAHLDKLLLKHNQNVFSLEFSALNFVNPEKVKYRYMLEGFNESWIETDAGNRQATYTNLNPGNYLFKVAATDADGTWTGPETTLRITVIPPFYATGWAMLLYAAMLIALVLLLIRTTVRREHLKYQRGQERLEHERMHELDNMKIKFFTNVSHEFRTPLTLILTPLDRLISGASDPGVRQQLVMVQRNGKRLLNLVNQLLDFRKMEVQKMTVNMSFDNIVKFLDDATVSFSDLGESKSIDLRFSSQVKDLNAWFDPDKMEKIMFNLLGNAFKFTGPKGRISVDVSKGFGQVGDFSEKGYLQITIVDTGIGIPPDKLNNIFDRFFQANSSGALMSQGTGIGLALTHEFVKLHLGTIEVNSELNKGTAFVIKLPLLTEEEVVKIDASVDTTTKKLHDDIALQQNADTEEASSPANNEKPVVLIVEDNEDLRFYLKDNLRQLYRVVEASNGMEALERIAHIQPTLIVSDVMMPLMDGLELCKRIKSDSNTSHIPVVMLTARNTNEQKVEGLEIGADEYITKPFNYELLELKIKKLIEQRKNLQRSLHVHYEIKPGEIGVTSLDEKFLQKALLLVEANISNVDFSVEKMSKELGVSRGHLYNKTVALTGKTPIEFIRIMRLKRAAQLLGKSQLSVSEIAFSVGFNDPKYFSKYFKDEFHVSPSDYAKAALKGASEPQ